MSKPRDLLRKHSEALLDDNGLLLAISLSKDSSYLSADMSWMLTKLVIVPLHTQTQKTWTHTTRHHVCVTSLKSRQQFEEVVLLVLR